MIFASKLELLCVCRLTVPSWKYEPTRRSYGILVERSRPPQGFRDIIKISTAGSITDGILMVIAIGKDSDVASCTNASYIDLLALNPSSIVQDFFVCFLCRGYPLLIGFVGASAHEGNGGEPQQAVGQQVLCGTGPQ